MEYNFSTIEMARSKKEAKLQEIRDEIIQYLKDDTSFEEVYRLCKSLHSHNITPPKYYLEVEYK
jgi:hypothetical protein